MGQKVNPILFRLQTNCNWASKWFAENQKYRDFVIEDIKIRRFLKRKLKGVIISKIIIEKNSQQRKITVYCDNPGNIIGKRGEEMEVIRKELMAVVRIPIELIAEEVKVPELDARLIALGIADQLNKRISLKKALRKPVVNAIKQGAIGIKIMGSGRLNGVEIARKEWYKEGRIPLQSIAANIDYADVTTLTTYGIIGIKVWIHKSVD